MRRLSALARWMRGLSQNDGSLARDLAHAARNVGCGLWAAVTAVLIAQVLEPQGVGTPWPFPGVLATRSLHRYGEITWSATGRAGPLFFSS